MIHTFKKSLQFAPAGVADCIKLNFTSDEEILGELNNQNLDDEDEVDDEDDSVTINSQDSADNETLFLYRFWTSCFPKLVNPVVSDLEVPGSIGLELIDIVIKLYCYE